MVEKIQEFKEDLRCIDETKYELVCQLEKLFLSENTIEEKFIFGGIGMFIKGALIGGIWVSKHHVSLAFSNGYLIEDKYKQLEGGGKFRRHIKLRAIEEVQTKHCKEYILSIIELEKAFVLQHR